MEGKNVVGKSNASSLGTRLHDVYGHFAETTTFGGIIHTWASTSKPLQILWFSILAALVAATVWNTVEVVEDYLSWPVVTNIRVADEQNILFPAVTVCNRNPVSCTKLAYAYLANPAELNNLMYYSRCHLILSQSRLRTRMVSNQST